MTDIKDQAPDNSDSDDGGNEVGGDDDDLNEETFAKYVEDAKKELKK